MINQQKPQAYISKKTKLSRLSVNWPPINWWQRSMTTQSYKWIDCSVGCCEMRQLSKTANKLVLNHWQSLDDIMRNWSLMKLIEKWNRIWTQTNLPKKTKCPPKQITCRVFDDNKALGSMNDKQSRKLMLL